MSQSQQVVVTDLIIYPVKSCKGIGLGDAELTRKGLLNDRCWLIVFENGLFATQRRLAKMALIEPALTEQGLVLSAPGCEPITISYREPKGNIIKARIWNDNRRPTNSGASPGR